MYHMQKQEFKKKPPKHVENIWSVLRAAENSFLASPTSKVVLQQTPERDYERSIKFHKSLIGKNSLLSQALEAGEKVQR